MPTIRSTEKVSIEYEDADPDDSKPVVLLVCGLGMQRSLWPADFIADLRKEGFRVVTYDNRDCGLSTHLAQYGTPNVRKAILQLMCHCPISTTYTLHDMANDGIALLDALKISKAHVVGVSMGGMIAQRIGFTFPERVQSLTMVMTSAGNRNAPRPTPEASKALTRRPADASEQAQVENLVKVFEVLQSPGFPRPHEFYVDLVKSAVARTKPDPAAFLRQYCAIAADTGKRRHRLSGITCPCVVIHGNADPLIPWKAGFDLHKAIKHSQWILVDGMGHDLPSITCKTVVAKLVEMMRG
jgi:pimeloyl-ACP methyl ester carboxylesterase